MTQIRLGVCGYGFMGSGIVVRAALSGFVVTVNDTTPDRIASGHSNVRAILEEAATRRLIKPGDVDRLTSGIVELTSVTHFADCDIVVEAVFEDLDVKRAKLAELEGVVPTSTILATNTSSFLITDVAANLRHPERCIGLHFFGPVPKKRLVEVVPGPRTSPDTIRRTLEICHELGMIPVLCADSAGFIVNRVMVPMLLEAVRLLERGEGNIPTIDAAACATFGCPWGPFKLMNETQVKTTTGATLGLASKLGKYHTPPELLSQQDNDPWDLSGKVDTTKLAYLASCLRAAACYEAAALFAENVATIEDIDLAVRLGLAWTRGPFELMNYVGLGPVVEELDGHCTRYGLRPASNVQQRNGSGETFRVSYVVMHVQDGTGTITLNRPDQLNVLTPQMMQDIALAVTTLNADPRVRRIVITGRGKAFAAGADVKWFVNHIEGGTISEIVQFTTFGHHVFDEIGRSQKPVIAYVNGLALGGGLELALACHYIVADPGARMAFPETGLGIYPGLGGTQRSVQRVGLPIARWLVLTGINLGVKEAMQIGLIDAIADRHTLQQTLHGLVPHCFHRRELKPQTEFPDSFEAVHDLFTDHDLSSLLSDGIEVGADPLAHKALTALPTKSRAALELAERLLHAATTSSIEAGLRLELSLLTDTFSHPDALEGLKALLERRRPKFQP